MNIILIFSLFATLVIQSETKGKALSFDEVEAVLNEIADKNEPIDKDDKIKLKNGAFDTGGAGILYDGTILSEGKEENVVLKFVDNERYGKLASREYEAYEKLHAVNNDFVLRVGIPKIYAEGTVDVKGRKYSYLAMTPLDLALDRHGPWIEEDLIRVFAFWFVTMSYFHGCGLRHNDIKPGNILTSVDEGMCYVIDFNTSTKMNDPSSDGTLKYQPLDFLERRQKIERMKELHGKSWTEPENERLVGTAYSDGYSFVLTLLSLRCKLPGKSSMEEMLKFRSPENMRAKIKEHFTGAFVELLTEFYNDCIDENHTPEIRYEHYHNKAKKLVNENLRFSFATPESEEHFGSKEPLPTFEEIRAEIEKQKASEIGPSEPGSAGSNNSPSRASSPHASASPAPSNLAQPSPVPSNSNQPTTAPANTPAATTTHRR